MQIHPQLLSLYRVSRFVNSLLLVCSILFVAIAVLGALLAYTVSFPPALFLTVLGIGGALLVHRFRTRWKEGEERKFQIGGEVLTHTGSRPMTLQYRGTVGFQGPMAILREQGGEGGSAFEERLTGCCTCSLLRACQRAEGVFLINPLKGLNKDIP